MRRPRLAVRTAVLSTLLLTGSLSAWYFTRPTVVAGEGTPVVVSDSRLPLFQWTPGEERVYRFTWDDLQRVELPMPVPGGAASSGAVEGTLHLEGSLALRALEVRPDGTRVRLSLKSLERHDAVLSGQQLFPDAASVVTQLPESASAWVELDAKGALLAVRFSEAEPAMFRQLAQTLAAELFPTTLRDAAEWDVVESNQTGEVQARFQFDGDSVLTRRRTRYVSLNAAGKERPFQQELRSLTRFERAPDGRMAGVSHDESLDATRTDGAPLMSRRMRLRVTFSARSMAPLLATNEDKPLIRKPEQIVFEGDKETALLRSQADGMTVDEVLRVLTSATRPESIPELDRFVRRAIAALKLEPGRTRELAASFLRPGVNPGLRELTMDVLAGTGHAQAQALMRELLQAPVAREHETSYGLMLQRAGFLEAPEPETARMLTTLREQARAGNDVATRRASEYALGGVVSKLPSGDPNVATYLRPLQDSLRDAKDPQDRMHALRALGNTRQEAVLDQAQPYLRDDSSEVRAAAAESLRGVPQEIATRMLLDSLVQEPERLVQAALLDALDARRLDGADLERLRAWVVSGGMVSGVEATLLNLITHRIDGGGAPVLQMLQALALRPGQQSSTRARIMSLMAQSSAELGG
ncbi:HEAT repeat-containing protein [Myxococcus fulvus]|uniref:HEAT repeat-containing protein n=1 Tax=Myxococcus fulvus TaxID=33 RepID=A0A511T2M3_MYXFU|nr:HEAT repeat domain-containing protein [Myxococcus fulvus]GEN08405.1 hypothetical protein MFU01_34420 [Myxococcus fulvus]SEU20677.1 HEAT repeat-containing protein [Myxococcus fulvus]